MSLRTSQLLRALAMTQGAVIAPALEGCYAGGSAATTAAVLMLLAQDLARPQPDPGEWAAIAARLALIDGDPGHADETRGLLSRLVEITGAAALYMPNEPHEAATSEAMVLSKQMDRL
jgi:hypothetical protein